MNIDDKTEEEYDDRFGEKGKRVLAKANVPPEIANAYDTRFNHFGVRKLYRSGSLPAKANTHDERFSAKDIAKIFLANCPPEVAKRYHTRFDGWDIAELFGKGNLPDAVNDYDKRFSFSDINTLCEDNVTSDLANRYDERFDGFEITQMILANCFPEEANKYDKRFDGLEIAYMFENKCTAEEANKYLIKFEGVGIALLYSLGITPENTDVKEQEKLYDVLSGIIKTLDSRYDWKNRAFYYFLGAGKSSVILRYTHLKTRKRTAWKFSRNIQQEHKMLQKVHYYHFEKDNLDVINVIDYKRSVRDGIALELEYLDGMTLQQVIEHGGPVPTDLVLKYSSDILNGIREMREAGVYHRDLHDKNILIDVIKNKATIIDLGQATDNPEEIHSANRAFGGNNDLISLGQLMYKMATGHNLFNEGPGFTCYSAVKDGVKTVREEVYDNPDKKTEYLNKVRQNVEDRELAEIIVTLLDDNLWIQPPLERVREMQKNIYEKIET